MLRHYDVQYREFPLPPVLLCTDVNDPSVFELIAQLQPDLVIVSGTNLLKPALIEEIHKHGPVMNLHTGLSPYVKGGPSCTYWCLALRQFGLIGNTVMWINAGIDSGDLIATERTHLTAEESLLELNIAVMEHAHALYAKCVSRFLQKDELPCVSQDQLSSGRLFLGKDWGFVEMVMALFNYYVYFRPGSPFFRTPEGVQLISIE
jgi:methionyl-tRNA formyltransferase